MHLLGSCCISAEEQSLQSWLKQSEKNQECSRVLYKIFQREVSQRCLGLLSRVCQSRCFITAKGNSNSKKMHSCAYFIQQHVKTFHMLLKSKKDHKIDEGQMKAASSLSLLLSPVLCLLSAAVPVHISKRRDHSSLPLDLLFEDASPLPQLLNCIFVTDE